MTVGITSKELYGFVVSSLIGMKDIQSDLVPKGKINVHSGKYRTRMDYYPDKNKDKIADIEIGTTKSKHKYFRLGLYPSKFGPGDFEHFKLLLELLLPEFNYPLLFKTARVSYIELAADSRSEMAHSFVPFRPRCNYSYIYKEQDGSYGSTYLGSKLSALKFCIYDKHRQLLAKNLPAPHKTHTRIEVRLRHTGLSPSELLEKMDNPFKKLEIADLQKARNASKDKVWQNFLDLCLEVGSAKALALHPKKRKLYMSMLRVAASWWWKPNHIWLKLPQALSVIEP
ncbi:MAG: hypothetical protein WB870_04260 [Gallionellaceae bacterium]